MTQGECGDVSGGGGASTGGSCNLTLDVTACNGAGNLPLKLRALIPGDFKFKSGHLRGYCTNLRNVGKNRKIQVAFILH